MPVNTPPSGIVWDRWDGGDATAQCPGRCRGALGWTEVSGRREVVQENAMGYNRVSRGRKGAVIQQTGKLFSNSLPTNAKVIHVQINNSSINNTATLTSRAKPIFSGTPRGGRKRRRLEELIASS